jgi:XTP/dITP diphosphohydrolase
MQLLVATRNAGKIRELAGLLTDIKVDWLSLDDIAVTHEVAETGSTFEENAILKSNEYAKKSQLLTLADDSGLEVDALSGRPGVHTARYGGLTLTPEQRYQLLLDELVHVPQGKRTARFRCVVALSRPSGLVGTSEGVCEGVIAMRPAGDGGFGYDPIFYIPERARTMAELPAYVKQQISHRGQAFARITPLLRQLLADA